MTLLGKRTAALFFLSMLIASTICSNVFAQHATTLHGIAKYGNVEFADSTNHKYPIDTPKHIRGAWAFIHQKRTAARYSNAELEIIRQRILDAAKQHGIHFRTDK